MKLAKLKRLIVRGLRWSIPFSLVAFLVACNPSNQIQGPVTLNSRYTDQQPALSGNGRFMAFVSSRDGRHEVVVYDLQGRQFVDLPRLNQQGSISENPSLSRTGRYLVYMASDGGRPEIELYDRASQRSEPLTRNYRDWVRNPRISADGRYIVFETSRRGQWDIEVLDRGSNIELDVFDGRKTSRP